MATSVRTVDSARDPVVVDSHAYLLTYRQTDGVTDGQTLSQQMPCLTTLRSQEVKEEKVYSLFCVIFFKNITRIHLFFLHFLTLQHI